MSKRKEYNDRWNSKLVNKSTTLDKSPNGESDKDFIALLYMLDKFIERYSKEKIEERKRNAYKYKKALRSIYE